jgi:RHS repeat-associated protein
VLSDGVYNYAYDNAGDLVRKTEIATGNVTSFGYDRRGRLTSVVERSAGSVVLSEVEYEYVVFDRRIGVVVNGTRIATVYDGESAWADYDATGNVIARYLHGDEVDALLARWRPGEGMTWHLTDRLGTVRDLLCAAGVVLNWVDYASFGQVLMQTNPSAADRFAFTGREFDVATGLYYYRARSFDPHLGRFTGEDRIRFAAGDANLYRYVANGPTNATDPTGSAALVEFVAFVEGVQFGYLLSLAVIGNAALVGGGLYGSLRLTQFAVRIVFEIIENFLYPPAEVPPTSRET